MLARREPDCQAAQWKRELRAAITRPEELLKVLDLDRRLLPGALAASREFRLLVPRGFAALMKRSDPNDPLLRQVLPRDEELRNPPGFCTDPVAECAAAQTPGLLQKYQGRALLLLTGACAIHCRYCFRRHFPHGADGARSDRTAAAIAHLADDQTVSEVILSGGDPLMLDDPVLAALIGKLDEIPHLKRLRLHTRIPIILPSRITDDLCYVLNTSRLQPIVVVHSNHVQELGAASRKVLGLLRSAGIPMLNQSVLLRGVNDNEHQLKELSEALFECGVLPYYLHMLDKVAGAAHYELSDRTATQLLNRLRALLPGYLVPRLVREHGGHPYKVPIEQQHEADVSIRETPYGTALPNDR